MHMRDMYYIRSLSSISLNTYRHYFENIKFKEPNTKPTRLKHFATQIQSLLFFDTAAVSLYGFDCPGTYCLSFLAAVRSRRRNKIITA